MRAYLRTRLHKLETCCAAVLADQSMQTRLSQRELQYAQVRFLCTLSIHDFGHDVGRVSVRRQVLSSGAALWVIGSRILISVFSCFMLSLLEVLSL